MRKKAMTEMGSRHRRRGTGLGQAEREFLLTGANMARMDTNKGRFVTLVKKKKKKNTLQNGRGFWLNFLLKVLGRHLKR